MFGKRLFANLVICTHDIIAMVVSQEWSRFMFAEQTRVVFIATSKTNDFEFES